MVGTRIIYRITAILLLLLIQNCSTKKKKEHVNEKPASKSLTKEELAKTYCGSCHIYPFPELLDKKTWRDGVLPQMGYRFGIYNGIRRDSLIEKGFGGRIVEDAGVFPVEPTISVELWEQIKQFYLDRAPDTLPKIEKRSVARKLKNFNIIVPSIPAHHPVVTQVKYHAGLNQFYFSNTKGDHTQINILNKQFKITTTLGLPNPVSNLSFRSDTLLILMMGSLTPSDAPSGKLIKTLKDKSGEKYEGYTLLLKNLKRPVDVAYADLDNDSLEDIVVAEFGNHTGRLSWFKNTGKGKFIPNVLNNKPGAVKIIVADINNDSRSDIIALMAQGDEGVDIYHNRGNGMFERERVLTFPPVYGSMHIELTDFNRDGFIDIVYVNGDNADYSSVLKPYHGIRIFLNDGTFHFKEKFFFPLHGAYKSIARDFDRDGDIDLAVIAFFPDFFNEPELSFVYMENVSARDDFEFELSTIPASIKGRWITMEAADIDNDGDEDLMLGSFTGMDIVNDSARTLIEEYIRQSPVFIILKNTTRK